jgi:integrase
MPDGLGQPGLPVPIAAEANQALVRYAHHARGAYARNTERALRADSAIFTSWCAENGADALPSSPATLVAFVDAQAQVKAPATVRRYVSSIATMHRAAEVRDPTEAPEVRLALKRMHRERGRRQKQAKAITFDIRNRMLAAAGTRLIDLRNKALLAVAYDTGCRRSELVVFDLADLRKAEDGTGTLLLRRSKTDQEGEGATLFIAADTVDMLSAWLTAAGIAEGLLFRSLIKGGKLAGPLAYESDPGQAVAEIFKRMAIKAGLPQEVAGSISGHSPRVGMAQDMAGAGIELPAIMQAGRWKTPAMPARYGERQAARRGAAAKLAAIQNR